MPETNNNLEAARAARGMTQVKLSDLSGVPQPTISMLENRQRPPLVRLSDLKALAGALGVNWRTIYTGGPLRADSREDVDEITAGHPIVTAHSRDAEDILAALGKVYGRDSADPEDRAWLGGLVQSWLDGIKEQSA